MNTNDYQFDPHVIWVLREAYIKSLFDVVCQHFQLQIKIILFKEVLFFPQPTL